MSKPGKNAAESMGDSKRCYTLRLRRNVKTNSWLKIYRVKRASRARVRVNLPPSEKTCEKKAKISLLSSKNLLLKQMIKAMKPKAAS